MWKNKKSLSVPPPLTTTDWKPPKVKVLFDKPIPQSKSAPKEPSILPLMKPVKEKVSSVHPEIAASISSNINLDFLAFDQNKNIVPSNTKHYQVIAQGTIESGKGVFKLDFSKSPYDVESLHTKNLNGYLVSKNRVYPAGYFISYERKGKILEITMKIPFKTQIQEFEQGFNGFQFFFDIHIF